MARRRVGRSVRARSRRHKDLPVPGMRSGVEARRRARRSVAGGYAGTAGTQALAQCMLATTSATAWSWSPDSQVKRTHR